MRKTIVLLAVISAVLVGAPWQSFSSSIVSSIDADPALVGGSKKPPALSNQDARIARIENGLLPRVIIKGQPTPTTTIAFRMKHFNVPGVSIAFFGQRRILWTRRYGFADAASKKPSPPRLFSRPLRSANQSLRSLR